ADRFFGFLHFLFAGVDAGGAGGETSSAACSSTDPMSAPAPLRVVTLGMLAMSNGRGWWRWSKPTADLPWSSSGLVLYRRSVGLGPPLSASGASAGSTPTMSCGPANEAPPTFSIRL